MSLPSSPSTEAGDSAVSWAAVFAGALVAAALTLILVGLGAGFGFASLSPWRGGPSAATFTIAAGIWLIVTQWLSSALGGYVAGRLRTRWTALHTDEVFFRDTAHGLIAWSLATVAGAFLLVAAGSSALGSGVRVAGGAARSVAQATGPYDADQLLRRASPETGAAGGSDQRDEVLHILAKDAATGEMPSEDHDYLIRIVAAHTGLSQIEAQKRVDQVAEQVKQAADKARKSAAAFSLFGGFSMLIGAFIAAVAASLGGHRRDLAG